MKQLILSLFIASIAFAGGPGPEEAECRTVCGPKPVKKVKKAKRKVAKKIVVAPTPVPSLAPEVKCPEAEEITIRFVIAPESTPIPVEVKEEEPAVVVGLRVALGGGFRVPRGPEAQLGLRVHVPAVHLGVDLATSFDFGTGIALLVYPYQGENLNWHVNAGILATGSALLSATDVPRVWDLTLGSGLEYRIARHVSLTFDWRWALPSPVYVAENGWPSFANNAQILGADGRYLDVKQVFGNSFTQSHFLFGLMFRN